MNVPVIREPAGVHEYDGAVMDLPPDGRKAALTRLGSSSPGERPADRHDQSHLRAAEQAARAEAETLQRNPLPHIQNLDLSRYDREYAPEPQHRRAREAHLARWPEAADASLESLRAAPAPAAGAPARAVRGLAEGIHGTTDIVVTCWVIAPAIIAAVIALPAGMILQDRVVHAIAAYATPGSLVHVYTASGLALLALAGLVIAIIGALGAATWAAISRTTTALRAE